MPFEGGSAMAPPPAKKGRQTAKSSTVLPEMSPDPAPSSPLVQTTPPLPPPNTPIKRKYISKVLLQFELLLDGGPWITLSKALDLNVPAWSGLVILP